MPAYRSASGGRIARGNRLENLAMGFEGQTVGAGPAKRHAALIDEPFDDRLAPLALPRSA